MKTGKILLIGAALTALYFFRQGARLELPPGDAPPDDTPPGDFPGLDEFSTSFTPISATAEPTTVTTYTPPSPGTPPPPMEVINDFWNKYNAYKLDIDNKYPYNIFYSGFPPPPGYRKTRLGQQVQIPLPSFQVPIGVTFAWDNKNMIYTPVFDSSVYG